IVASSSPGGMPCTRAARMLPPVMPMSGRPSAGSGDLIRMLPLDLGEALVDRLHDALQLAVGHDERRGEVQDVPDTRDDPAVHQAGSQTFDEGVAVTPALLRLLALHELDPAQEPRATA